MCYTENISILIVSCDKYQDMWEPYFFLFDKNWSNCPYKVYLMTNYLKPDLAKIGIINVGEDISWSDNLAYSLKKIKSKYVFILLDDFFIVDTVKNDQVVQVVNWAIDNDVDYLHLFRYPRPKKLICNNIGIIPARTMYRVSTISSLFKKEVLSNLLDEKESAWDFEIKGSLRSKNYNEFYSVDDDLIPVVNGVIRGKWNRKIIKYFKKNKISYCSNRPVLSVREQILYELSILRSKIFSFLPYNVQVSLRNLFRS